MKKALVSLALGALIITNSAQGEDSPQKKLNPWTQCGLGAMIFNGESGGWAAGAAISNIIWDLGTTAVSSNVSSQQSCSRAKWDTAMFIDENLQDLEQQIAQGYGENIDSIMDLYGCNISARSEIVSTIRSNMAPILSSGQYSNQTHDEKAFAYYDSVNSVVSSFPNDCNTI